MQYFFSSFSAASFRMNFIRGSSIAFDVLEHTSSCRHWTAENGEMSMHAINCFLSAATIDGYNSSHFSVLNATNFQFETQSKAPQKPTTATTSTEVCERDVPRTVKKKKHNIKTSAGRLFTCRQRNDKIGGAQQRSLASNQFFCCALHLVESVEINHSKLTIRINQVKDINGSRSRALICNSNDEKKKP